MAFFRRNTRLHGLRKRFRRFRRRIGGGRRFRRFRVPRHRFRRRIQRVYNTKFQDRFEVANAAAGTGAGVQFSLTNFQGGPWADPSISQALGFWRRYRWNLIVIRCIPQVSAFNIESGAAPANQNKPPVFWEAVDHNDTAAVNPTAVTDLVGYASVRRHDGLMPWKRIFRPAVQQVIDTTTNTGPRFKAWLSTLSSNDVNHNGWKYFIENINLINANLYTYQLYVTGYISFMEKF